MNPFHFGTPLRIALRAGATVVLWTFWFSVALGQAARPAPAKEAGARVTETQVDVAIKDDPTVERMLGAYSPKVRELGTVIGALQGELQKGGVGAGSLGNFVTDGLLAAARKKLGKSVVLAVTNAGGLRKNAMSEGDIHVSDIWELLPFENALVQFDLTGEQLLKLLNQVLMHGDAQSGARIIYRVGVDDKPSGLVSARLLSNGREEEIQPQATYAVVTIDYLWKRQSTTPAADDGYSVLGNAKKIEPLGLNMRDAMIQYVKDETAAGRNIRTNLDGRFRPEATGEVRP